METNFMNGENFVLSPLKRMEIVWSSAILGEPQYYREPKNALPNQIHSTCIYEKFKDKSSEDIFMESLKQALDYNFEAVLRFAVRLRNESFMRLGPQIIIVEAALHSSRAKFNKENPKLFRQLANECIKIPTDIYSQLEHYIKKKGSKNQLPGVLKRVWKDSLTKLSVYQASKYINKAHIVDIIRLCHPRSSQNEIIRTIVRQEKLCLGDQEYTWEQLRSQGKTWVEITQILGKKFPHMALLRNLRNLASLLSQEQLEPVLEILENGVKGGQQFPFRYYTAYQQFFSNSDPKPPKKNAKSFEWKLYRQKNKNSKDFFFSKHLSKQYALIRDSLERCMSQALVCLPEIPGHVVSLCDNSGSAWGAFNSTYGSQTVATIGNLSGLLAALKATKGGKVGLFGDRLEMYTVNKDRGILEQLEEINELGKTVGQRTENGIWLWFKHAFESKDQSTDHLFIYSDMQAGHGKLYGSNASEYQDFRIDKSSYINVIDLIQRHRYQVNPKLNVFTVQTAGYDNALIPEVLPRTCIMAGWTGNEISYASKMIEIWET